MLVSNEINITLFRIWDQRIMFYEAKMVSKHQINVVEVKTAISYLKVGWSYYKNFVQNCIKNTLNYFNHFLLIWLHIFFNKIKYLLFLLFILYYVIFNLTAKLKKSKYLKSILCLNILNVNILSIKKTS